MPYARAEASKSIVVAGPPKPIIWAWGLLLLIAGGAAIAGAAAYRLARRG
jgi:hypothetical protein